MRIGSGDSHYLCPSHLHRSLVSWSRLFVSIIAVIDSQLIRSGTDSGLVIGQAGIEGIIAGAVTMRCAAMLFDIFTHTLSLTNSTGGQSHQPKAT